jgi:hypothetical protein
MVGSEDSICNLSPKHLTFGMVGGKKAAEVGVRGCSSEFEVEEPWIYFWLQEWKGR